MSAAKSTAALLADLGPITAADPERFRHYSVRSRDESFRPFDPERIAIAIAKAVVAAGESDRLDAEQHALCGRITDEVCHQLLERRPEGGSFYIEEVQDQAELGLMRAGLHEVARRFVLYREERRRARQLEPRELPTEPTPSSAWPRPKTPCWPTAWTASSCSRSSTPSSGTPSRTTWR